MKNPVKKDRFGFPGISGAGLKMFAVVTMFIDHLTCCFLEVARGADGASVMYHISGGEVLDLIGRGIGRSAFPIFCFLITEGYMHTHSRAKYLLRLILFGLVSWVPFKLLFFPYSDSWIHTDTMFTLALGLTAIWITDALSGTGGPGADMKRRVAAAAASAAAIILCAVLADRIHSDYGGAGVITVVIFYLFRRQRALSCAGAYVWLSVYSSGELLSAPGVFLISRYNGEKGRQSKYFFYIFYPGHLLVLYLIRRALFGA